MLRGDVMNELTCLDEPLRALQVQAIWPLVPPQQALQQTCVRFRMLGLGLPSGVMNGIVTHAMSACCQEAGHVKQQGHVLQIWTATYIFPLASCLACPEQVRAFKQGCAALMPWPRWQACIVA